MESLSALPQRCKDSLKKNRYARIRKAEMMKKLARLGLVVLVAAAFTGCASSRMSGVSMVNRHVASIETIAANRGLTLDGYERIALFQLGKVGVYGVGGVGGTATVYVRDDDTQPFGPPTFVKLGGPSIRLGYAGLNLCDCLLLFRQKEAAIRFARSSSLVNFTHEAAFLNAGRKAMTVGGSTSFSDGAGLCLGFVELEFMVGGPQNALHKALYDVSAPVDKILLGDVTVPDDLKNAMERLNVLAEG